jgi:TRAP-type C4-dicarboxylate transport system, periplasmic component
MAIDLPYITDPKFQDNFYKGLDEGELGKEVERAANEIGLAADHAQPVRLPQLRQHQEAHPHRGRPGRPEGPHHGLPRRGRRGQGAWHEPRPVAWGETYTALQQGTVDAEGNTFSLLNDAKHTEVLKYAMDSNHNYSMHLLLMNKKKWDSLTPEQQRSSARPPVKPWSGSAPRA